MKSIKLALLAGAAVAVSAAAAQADDLDALKAQIETLNARVAAMETAPSVPAGYQLLAVSEGASSSTPGLMMDAQDAKNYGSKSTIISVMPTADAPAGATISWSGFARAGLVFDNVDGSLKLENREDDSEDWEEQKSRYEDPDSDVDVKARGQIRVTASTDTAVGEVGVDIRLRGNFDGNGTADVYSDVAWGYWAMTPELTLGGGYAGSLGTVGYTFDESCQCNYIDTMAFNPGDTTQMRLSYASGPFSAAVALEDASTNTDDVVGDSTENTLGVAGQVAYASDMVSGEISGVWRDIDEDHDEVWGDSQFASDSIWMVGAGLGFNMTEMFTLNVAAATGEGPAEAIDTDSGDATIDNILPWNASWWGVSGFVSANLSDEIHAEIGAGYRTWDFDDVEFASADFEGEADKWVVGGGLYYDPVEQLTIGLEASYSETTGTLTRDNDGNVDDVRAELEKNETIVDLVSIWRF